MSRQARWRLSGLNVFALAVLALLVLGRAEFGTSVVQAAEKSSGNSVIVGHSYHNDTSPPLREMEPQPFKRRPEREANENPKIPFHHKDGPDETIQSLHAPTLNMPVPSIDFDGVAYPGVSCNCAPPDTDGEVGATQYVQIVNEGYQVFDKT